jgi:hypothetical protein
MIRPDVANWMRAVACVAGLAAMLSCGGGGSVGSGGTGAPLSSAEGTVTGFGSIFIDGVRFDDANVTAVTEDQPGHDAAAQAALGDRVQATFDDAGVLTALRIEPSLKGTVSSVDSGGMTVLGQTVRVNADPAQGPVTQFGGGYVGLASVKANDIVEVHGVLVAQGAATVIQATRVERQDTPPAFLKVTGIVADLSAGSFRLGTLTVTTASAKFVPGNATPANGQAVLVMAPPGALQGATLAASQVRIKSPQQAGKRVQTSGTVASLDTTARTFVVGTQKVDYAGLPVTALANGDYVRVRGTLAADGTLVASDIDVRDGSQETQAEVHGNIARFDPVARTFSVRGVDVDASGVTPQDCPSGLANGVSVAVQGNLSATTLIATSVRCEP